MADRIDGRHPRLTGRAWRVPLVVSLVICGLVIPTRAQRGQRGGAARGVAQGAQPLRLTVAGQERDALVFAPAMQRQAIASVRAFDGAMADGRSCGTGCTLYPSTLQAPVQVMTHPGKHQVAEFATEAIVAFFKSMAK